MQQSHGLLSCAQWTGIPFSWLLDEAGVSPDARWVVFEGGDGSGHLRSIPIEKVMDDSWTPPNWGSGLARSVIPSA